MPGGLVGRERELADLELRVRECRLVTIVGPGGVGKTALARDCAGAIENNVPASVGFVDLTRVSDPEAVRGAVAAQLGFDSFDALVATPVDRPVLLVVDNCEHLLDAAASAIEQVLGACRQATVIATSRSPLELPGESVVTLGPLALPAVGDDPHSSPSVGLFVERCGDAGAAVGDAEIALAGELCRRLDGLPLAIELAAARTRALTLAEILARLDDSADALDRPRFRGDARHRSLRSTIGWSYDLLAAGPTHLLEELGVFAGPFSATTARAVASDPDRFDSDLDELVFASLVTVDTTGAETRYRLLDAVRRFALDRLGARGGVTDAYDRFVDHVLCRSIELIRLVLAKSWRAQLIRDFVAAYDDIAEALRWCSGHDETPDRAYQICPPLSVIAQQGGHAEEITELMRRLHARFPETDTLSAALAQAVLATGEYITGNPATAVAVAQRALIDHPGPDMSTVLLQRVVGRARSALGDSEGSVAVLSDGARVGHELGMTAIAQELEVSGALVDADGGDVDRSLAAVTAVVEDARAAGSLDVATWASAARSWILLRIDPATALAAADASLTEALALDFPMAVAVSFRSKAFAHLLLDDVPAASTTVDALLDDMLRRRALSNLRLVVDVTAALAHRCGHPNCERLTATALSLPITVPVCSLLSVISLPTAHAEPFARNEVINAVRATIDDITAGRSAVPATHRRPTSASIRTVGEQCEIDFEGRSVSVRTSKGINDIVRLVGAAGREIHCAELADVVVEQSTTGDVIDADARHHYEERIRDLQSDIDEAEGDNDYGRSYRLQVELDALIDHLTASLGRGQRVRRGTDTVERARSAVTHRVRNTIRQLSKIHPSLSRHFEHSISTGTYCSYSPEQPVAWSITT